jgi:cytochrome c oxidase subunit 2
MNLKAKQLKKLALNPLLLLGTLSTGALAEEAQRFQTNMPIGVTEIGQEIYDLHMLVFWICVVTGILVFGYMFYSMIAYRKSKGHEPATFHDNTLVEIIWTIIPAIILLGMAVPASYTLMDIYDTTDADLDVLVTGYQWKWKFEYIVEG